MKFIKLLILLLIPISKAGAHPVAYKDALAVMTWANSHSTDIWTAYSIEPKWSVGARYIRMDQNDTEMNIYLPQVSFLVKRWNEFRTQSNIYLYGGVGNYKMGTADGSMSQLAVEADSESRSLYILGRVENYWPENLKPQISYEFRVGAAPYESEYDEIGAWLIIQSKYNKQILNKLDVTPLLRVYYRSMLAEFGISLDGDPNINLMFHF